MGPAHPTPSRATASANPLPKQVNRQAVQKAQAWHQRNDARAFQLQLKYNKDIP